MKFDYNNLNNRLVLNLTNKCNERCPFCFMACGKENSNMISLERVKEIWETTPVETEKVEIQLTGGEPTLNPEFLEIVRYFSEKENIPYIMIDSNGSETENFMDELNEIAQNTNSCIVIKFSVNYYLMEKYPWHLEKIKSLYNKYHKEEKFEIILAIRYRMPIELDNYFLDKINNDETLNKIAQIKHPIVYIGRARDLKLGNTVIDSMETKSAKPFIFSSDGISFLGDYNARNDYELSISKCRGL